jgi:pimeloyl-ACP methyl ester carboxylesterase
MPVTPPRGRPRAARSERPTLAARLLRALGLLLMLSALALWLSRAPDRPVETLVARWALPPSTFLDLDGQLVHLRDVGPRGDPAPMVLLHGTSASLHTWEPWVRGLQAQRRVITLDLPGFGLTGPRADGDYRGDADARFVLRVLDTLQVRHVVLVGHSLGGEVAWRLATLAPERVQRLVLIDATGLPVEGRTVPLGWRLARLPGLGWLLESVLPRALVVQGLVQTYADPARVTDEVVDRYYDLTLREGNRRALIERLRQYAWGADADRVRRVTQPTLILWGGRDRLIPPAAGQEFQRRIAGSVLHVLADLGHAPQEEDPAASLAVLQSFLARD